MKRTLLSALVFASLAAGAAWATAADASTFQFLASVYADQAGGGLKVPEGVACNDAGAFVVADTGNGRLVRYSMDKEGPKGGQEVTLPEHAYPTRVQWTPGGEILFLDGRQHRIGRVGADGAFQGYVDFSGVPEPSAVMVRSFKVGPGGGLFVLDLSGRRVVEFDEKGAWVAQTPFPEAWTSLDDLAVDARGTVFLLDSVSAVIYSATRGAAFAPLTKPLKEYLNFAANLAVSPRGELYLSDQNGSGIVVLGPDGSFLGRHSSYGWKEGLLRYPSQLCIDAAGDLFVADRDNSRLEIFQVK